MQPLSTLVTGDVPGSCQLVSFWRAGWNLAVLSPNTNLWGRTGVKRPMDPK